MRTSHDQELQDLYDQVLQGFAEDDNSAAPTPTTSSVPRDKILSIYDSYDSSVNENHMSTTAQYYSPRPSPTPLMPQQPQVQPQQQRRPPRPLPSLPPGASPFPEAHPYMGAATPAYPVSPEHGLSYPYEKGNSAVPASYQSARQLPPKPPSKYPSGSPYYDSIPLHNSAPYRESPIDPAMAATAGMSIPNINFPNEQRGYYTPNNLPSRPAGARIPSTPGVYGNQPIDYPVVPVSDPYSYSPRLNQPPPTTWRDAQEDTPSRTDISRSESLNSSNISGTSSGLQHSSSVNSNGMRSSKSSLSKESTDETVHHHNASASAQYSRPSISISDSIHSSPPVAGTSRRSELEIIANLKRPLALHEESDDEFFDDSDEEDESRFVNLALLSHLAVKLRDKIPRGTHVKGSIPYPCAFTGKDIVTTIQSQIQRELLSTMNISTSDRSVALAIARSLQGQLLFYEVEWGGKALTDSVEDVFMFLDDQEGISDVMPEREELPTGIVTFLTKCYVPSCHEEGPCYSYACPKRKSTLAQVSSYYPSIAEDPKEKDSDWADKISKPILDSLPDSEIKRQTIVHTIIKKEEQYVEDLDTIEKLYLRPLRMADPPVIPLDEIDDFIDTVFGNVLDLRECNKRLLEVMYVRQREQGPIVQRIGDVFLTAAAEFRLAYPTYVGHLPVAEKRMKDEIEKNPDFKRFLEHCARQTEARKLDLKHFLTRPSEHLQKYPVLLEAVMQETTDGNPDVDYLEEAIQSIKNLSTVATLRTFQNAMGKGPTSKLQWFDLVPKEQLPNITKHEAKRQSIIWELIQGEMAYVRDLELIETIFIKPLWTATPPIIPRERLKSFLQDVFHNYLDILRPQRELLDQLQELQREEHPLIRSITAPVFNAALNWTDAYMEYIPHHPIATYRVDDEMAKNPEFKKFIEQCTRHPEARKLDIKSFIMRPVARLLRYPLLLQGVMDAAPAGHEDKEAIPQVLEVIKDLGKAADGGVETAKQKVELWRYDANLVFRTGEQIDLDLRADTRSLIHTGKLLRQPEGSLDMSGWTELFVLLFDNYLVMTKPKERDGVIKYHVNRRPIPLELLSVASFSDPPQQRGTAFLKGFQRDKSLTSSSLNGSGAGENTNESTRSVYPCTIHHNGRMGGLYVLYSETADGRAEWKRKLDEALALRAVIQDSNKVFEIEPLSADTFFMPSIHGMNSPAWNNDNPMTGKVTCSVPFSTTDGRGLVAVGCAEGVWIGLRHDSRSLKRVLHLKNVTQCAMLEDFGIFLVLADRALFAYHIEALVPSGVATSHASSAPQRLNGSSSVQFFTVGSLQGRTLIIYVKKKQLDSVFRMLEPVVGKINEKVKNPSALARLGIGTQKSDWFRIYREFFLPSEAYDVIFLKARIVILCSKGFEIMDLAEFKSETIPRRDDPRISHIVKRLDSCKPRGMYRSSENEFLLCYNEFGLYVDRHGETSRPQNEVVVEWEGTAEHVAFHPPYVLLFDSRFIEIRHIETGRLAQIIPGVEVRCTWDGRGAAIPTLHTPGPDGWQESTYQEPRVHGVMKAQDASLSNGGPPPRSRPTVQQVFELVPTIPLYLPGSLQSPNTSAYFPPPSPTPTHSPNPSMSYPSWNR